MRFEESPATPEEDSYGYRVEWDDSTTTVHDMIFEGKDIEHYGPGSVEVNGFDNAWDVFNDYRKDYNYIGVRLIRIDAYGNETVYKSK